ncbi:hypothetical protein L207DRAFT_416457 [Hyaloscypha variabilis F]|uniref:TPR-like protein n=1 Tax=Hyaloscypha variabilis (strain UAMH 11265 / GT02V1 / F) TaxID=1149755 RepID=A0A2J6S8S5_HYAVF|nr:hypothetical protein L207DRAFT_416457 [Hyaloscypha variabilis F]
MWDSYKAQQTELEDKLSKLRKHFSDDHPAVIALIDDLANVYYKNGYDEKAEHLCRNLVILRRRILGLTHPKTLEACLKATHALIGQSKYYEAQSQNLALLSVILKFFAPNHGLVTYATSIGARIATILGQDKEAESLYIRLLQMNMSLYGPRHRETLGAMVRLGEVISWSRPSDGEQILRTALDFYLDEGESTHEESCRVITSLSDARWYSGDFDAGRLLANYALESFSATLGPNHPSILSAQTALGMNLAGIGKLEESEALYREVIRIRTTAGRTRSLALSVCTARLRDCF